MKHFLNRFTKIEAVATLLPAAMVFAVLTVPVQSDNTDTSVPMDFDSVGAMLRDIDREKSLDVIMASESTSDDVEFESYAYSEDENCSGGDLEEDMSASMSEETSFITVDDSALLARVEAALMAAEAAIKDVK